MGTPLTFFTLSFTLYLVSTYGHPTFNLDDCTKINKDLEDLITTISGIKFLLYTKKNPTEAQVLKYLDLESLVNSNWDGTLHTRVITHGWQDNGNGKPSVQIRNALLKEGSYNVLVIDWERIASNFYSKTRISIPGVARYFAKQIQHINKLGVLDYDETLLIGHGLGAHLMSLTAKNIDDGKIGQVLGLDPSGPGYGIADENTRIDKSHATYVQIIHTNSGKLGLDGNVGTSDFIVNGGKSQPTCGSLDDLVGECAHAKSYEYYVESIANPKAFEGIPEGCTSSCTNAYMGGSTLDSKAVGVYTVATSAESYRPRHG